MAVNMLIILKWPYKQWSKITISIQCTPPPLQRRHNERDVVSNHQPHNCLLKCLFRRRSKKTPKLRVIGLGEGNSPGTGEIPHKWPVTRKMFPFDDVIMSLTCEHQQKIGSFCKCQSHTFFSNKSRTSLLRVSVNCKKKTADSQILREA